MAEPTFIIRKNKAIPKQLLWLKQLDHALIFVNCTGFYKDKLLMVPKMAGCVSMHVQEVVTQTKCAGGWGGHWNNMFLFLGSLSQTSSFLWSLGSSGVDMECNPLLWELGVGVAVPFWSSSPIPQEPPGLLWTQQSSIWTRYTLYIFVNNQTKGSWSWSSLLSLLYLQRERDSRLSSALVTRSFLVPNLEMLKNYYDFKRTSRKRKHNLVC